jgi:zinc protease
MSGLQSIGAEDLQDFKNRFLTRDRLIVTIAGDITKEEATQAADRIFGGLPAKGPQPSIPDTTATNAGKTYLYRADIPQTMIEIMIPSFDSRDEDYHALQVLNYIFGGAGFGSRLMDEAREKRGLTYGIYSSLQEYRHTDVLSISTSTKNERTADMLSVIRAEMERLAREGVSAQELSDAQSYITGSMPLSLTSTTTIADMMMSLRLRGLKSTYLDTFASDIRAVSAEDVKRVAARLLNPLSMTIALVGQPAETEGMEEVKELPNVR